MNVLPVQSGQIQSMCFHVVEHALEELKSMDPQRRHGRSHSEYHTNLLVGLLPVLSMLKLLILTCDMCVA